MEEIWNGLVKALQLIFTFDPEVMQVAWLSIRVAVTSVLIASIICLPLGSLIHFNNFRGKRVLISIIQTFYSVPTVTVGLFVFILFSNKGPLGGLDILFTPTVMVIGQVILVLPILTGLTITGLNGVDKTITDTARSLGASNWQTATAIIREARFAVTAAVILAFGRAISEVGLALMVGGNIRGFTRVLTTAISLETSKGDIELSLALGIILIFIALVVNIVMNRIQQRQ
ncbi:MAG: ABC transporter permease [Chloroflexi bacterium RBG_13_51_18]|nr:MAG: ABC transporter permease [Chloroflexi bacterium RBG_13_51_18]